MVTISTVDKYKKLEELENLTEEERAYALKILKEFSDKGHSETYVEMLQSDYDEIPVDIETFLTDKQFLGKGLTDDEGRFTIFPYWVETLKNIYPDPLKPASYDTLALTGSIGIGKSTIAVIIGCYELYRMLCLKDPYIYYGLQPIDLISFAVMNITKDAARGVAWDKMQSLIQSSSWFMARGTISRSDNPEWRPPKGIELLYGSQPQAIIGRAVFWAFFDEISFMKNMDVEKQKAKAKSLVNTAATRMQSRFMKGEYNPTILVLASSKRTDQSYMESFIEEKKKNESKTTLVVDEPQWVIRTDKDSERKFKVALGNKFLDSEVLPLDTTPEQERFYVDRGFRILDVPYGYYENFVDDINTALTDIAGISTSSSNRYIAGTRLSKIVDDRAENLFTKDIIQVGNGEEDKTQYYDFIDLSRLDPKLKKMPLYIHMDLSVSGDKTGIGGVVIVGKKPSVEGKDSSKELHYRTLFSVAVKAPKGYQISFEKNRNLIYWLKEQGFNIKAISTDSFQSTDTGQQLSAKGFKFSTISVDRVDKDRINKPYQSLKSAIYEERLQTYYSRLLHEELLGLERNNSNGKIDHSPSSINSKDVADAICGALWNASRNADEFAYEWGEDLLLIDKVNNPAAGSDQRQMVVDFEEALKQAHNPLGFEERLPKKKEDEGLPVGPLMMEGIMIW